MSSVDSLTDLEVKLHRLRQSDTTMDPSPKLARRAAWNEVKGAFAALKEAEAKREEAANLIASQGQILASFAHALIRAVMSGSPYSTRLAYADLARYAKISIEGEKPKQEIP